ncbi:MULTISPECIES: hypothetical protein [unclassified Paraflavitalea]|uniref:hypothetical protein n=1 Tax=unclassified Paraflavitalea TaxID=2798305 RepID=UPI003D329308
MQRELSSAELHKIALIFIEYLLMDASKIGDASLLPVLELIYAIKTTEIEKFAKSGKTKGLERIVAGFEDSAIDMRSEVRNQLTQKLYQEYKFVLGEKIFEKIITRSLKKGKIKDFDDFMYLAKLRRTYECIPELLPLYSQADLLIADYYTRNNLSGEDSNFESIVEPQVATNSNLVKSSIFFPFNEVSSGDIIGLELFLSQPELYPSYHDMFQRFGYEGNGYCWEGHIIQILEQLSPKLLTAISFESEAGSLLLEFNTVGDRDFFQTLLCPILSDIDKFQEWVAKADHSRIDD